MKLDELVDYLDDFLRLDDFDDISQNGLQVEGPDEVTKVVCAVDACLAAAEQAIDEDAQLLLVHHGLFWDKPLRLVGPHFERVRTLIQGGCGLYGVHLPLDAHPEVGNGAEMARLLKLEDTRPFGDYHGTKVGVYGELASPVDMPTLIGRLITTLGRPPLRVLDHGPEDVHRIGYISGGGASMIDQAEAADLDTFITGETKHSQFHQAAERGLNVLFAGHYATETLGVQALARHLEDQFGLETLFLDIPTGM
jgi:dinuclear metal center YbgI/SA1388 family protein